MKILIIHGPNLNMLGKREPDIYGSTTLSDINNLVEIVAKSLNVKTEYFQSNSEGEIVTKIQNSLEKIDGIVINPAAYTHTSVAIRDAILSTDIPTVEVHISNIYKREKFRQNSYVSGVALGVISGFGTYSYILGLKAITNHLKSKK
ncbi:MAG: type II 3-dehydroquinate dehydratase [Candidatus Dadabacteria bacterium]|nr:type II 3-dehydroquinate dehydratase [Candidatus Dadabacteria bacterium]NIS09188.1 type II 3-dehydroquinate dehydratase [Candidatus Dadabacteria bacterium]NIV41804.1 type II 3-dehydroquinate dehydratase [Candidatus Dadabacteria bacterium]NIX15747.1 type II 3-dehydroquinate dehydratase [Candidatus Dadabacteria bacterium]NIY22619.1 type II 3-dehydroquinate dehydratase [Candidatus Dadabacteria bacterium]